MMVRIYSDGSAKRNPCGPGGYGTIVQYCDKSGFANRVEEFAEGFDTTSNNRMELMGVIIGLESLEVPSDVIVTTDSKYVVNAFNEDWISKWRSNGWKTAGGNAVKNQDLWERLLDTFECHRVKFRWVKGHAGHPENERCDQLATAAAAHVPMVKMKNGKYTMYYSKSKNTNPIVKLRKDLDDILSDSNVVIPDDIQMKIDALFQECINQYS